MTDPLTPPSDILESLLEWAKAKQRQEDEARQIAEEREQRLRDHAAQRERLAIAFDHAFEFPNEEIRAGRSPGTEAFRRWAERFVELAKVLRESDRAIDGLCLGERLRAVAGKPMPAALKYASGVLLLASEGNPEAVASALERGYGDEELSRFVLWLPYILDNLWHPFPNQRGQISMAMPPEGTGPEDYEQVEQAFGWFQLGLPDDPTSPAQHSCGQQPHALYPLVGERTGRRAPLRELARDQNRDRQSRYCQGFDPDWWLPALLAAEWRSYLYPREATRESVEQWLEQIDSLRKECLGPFGMPERAAELAADRENDLQLIRDHAPQLYDAVMGPRETPSNTLHPHPVEIPMPALSAGPLSETAAAMDETSGVSGQADSKTDKRPTKKQGIPLNPAILRLAKKIKKDREKGMSQIDSAREYCECDERKAQSLLRQVRRYPHLLE